MKCPECVAQGLKSKVYIGPETYVDALKTGEMRCSPWYAEDGSLHHHNYDTTTTAYECSNKHYFKDNSPKPLCPTCGLDW